MPTTTLRLLSGLEEVLDGLKLKTAAFYRAAALETTLVQPGPRTEHQMRGGNWSGEMQVNDVTDAERLRMRWLQPVIANTRRWARHRQGIFLPPSWA
jgi:hypothetical protein